MNLSKPSFWAVRDLRSWVLLPVSLLFRSIVYLRRLAYRKQFFDSWRSPVPVVIVGNISVGGAGKTPLVIAFAEILQARGLQVAIATKGYGGTEVAQAVEVYSDSNAYAVGDEAVLLAQRTMAPVVACSNRVLAVQHLLSVGQAAATQFDCILCDDGMQHYALQRDLEIAVVDAAYQFGNGHCLPAGPLREPVSRLRDVDLVVYSGVSRTQSGYQLQGTELVCLHGVNETRSIDSLRSKTVNAVAGIAAPERFFEFLRDAGLEVVEHPFGDHTMYQESDLIFDNEYPVVMTEKDSVKCRKFAVNNSWYVPVTAVLDESVVVKFNRLINNMLN